MTLATAPMVTRCPKCRTAFRITHTQLQSARGAVRCGSCLHVFKAQDHLVNTASKTTGEAPSNPAGASVNPPATPTKTAQTGTAQAAANWSSRSPASHKPLATSTAAGQAPSTPALQAKPAARVDSPVQPVLPLEPNPLKSKSPEPKSIEPSPQKPAVQSPTPPNATAVTAAVAAAATPTPASKAAPSSQPLLRKSALDDEEDILISDDMDAKDKSGYEFDGFLDMDLNPKRTVSLFDRKVSDEKNTEPRDSADESWAEMLMEDEEPSAPLVKRTQHTDTHSAIHSDIHSSTQHSGSPEYMPGENDQHDTALAIGNWELPTTAPETSIEIPAETSIDTLAEHQEPSSPHLGNAHLGNHHADNTSTADTNRYAAGPLTFSLIADASDAPTSAQAPQSDEQFEFSEELSAIPDAGSRRNSDDTSEQASREFAAQLFDQADADIDEQPAAESKRQLNAAPKQRGQEGSRAALLMNIMPAPLEFTAKRMRRWYQKKLWPSLSVLALLVLVVQVAWLKFDYLSRVEPYRSAYAFVCPLVGCKLPTLVDTRQIKAYNLVVRANTNIANALLVDAVILNSAPFEQPFPDLVLAFSNLDNQPVASRRFTPEEYLGGELAGRKLMPREQPIYLNLDLVDPGPEAANYHLYIP